MHSNLKIGPSFQSGSLGVRIVKSMKGQLPCYSGAKIYQITPDQDYELMMLTGKALESPDVLKPLSIENLMKYINGLGFKKGDEVLNLSPPGTKGYNVSIVGTHAVIVKDKPKLLDVELDIYSELLN